MYREGIGVEQSIVKALQYYQMAAENGYEAAKCRIDFWIRAFKLKENTIFYPNCQLLSIRANSTNEIDLEALKNLLYQNRFESVYLILSNLSREMASIIRDAMLQNPRFTFLSFIEEDNLLFSFEQAGYQPQLDLKQRKCKKNGEMYQGYVFIGRQDPELENILQKIALVRSNTKTVRNILLEIKGLHTYQNEFGQECQAIIIQPLNKKEINNDNLLKILQLKQVGYMVYQEEKIKTIYVPYTIYEQNIQRAVWINGEIASEPIKIKMLSEDKYQLFTQNALK